MYNQSKINEYVQGLRDLADFIEARPDIAAYMTVSPLSSASPVCYVWQDVDKFRELLHQLGSFEKTSSDTSVGGVRRFGPHTLSIRTPHENVCERRVVGTETQLVYPEDVELVEREVEVVEWVCPESLLRESA